MVEQVQIPHSVVVGKEPSPEEIIVGGLAVNLADRALYTKGYDNVVIRLNDVTFDQVIKALKFTPVKPIAEPLPVPASDLATAIALVNTMRQALIDCGIGS